MATWPHAAPRTAVVWAVLREELARFDRRVTAVDVGGGTGGFAVPLAMDGHQVTVVDSSPDALASLMRRASDAGVADRVAAVQGDADALAELIPAGSADLVLCHSLLEVVDDPVKTVAALVGCLRVGGAASVVVANRVAAVLARAIGGQLGAAMELLGAGSTGALSAGAGSTGALSAGGGLGERLRRRFDREGVTGLLADAGLLVERVHGVRVVADLMPGAVAEAAQETLLEFELAAAATPPYRDIATQLHLLARKPSG